MDGILNTHSKYASEYDKIADEFNAPTVKKICEKIYNYLHKYTHYVIESDDSQTLRSPAAILRLGANPKIGLDCKSYALFIGGVLDALKRAGKKINWCYRFASYKMVDKVPHHVFVVVNPGTANEIWVDPVIKPFNNHKLYSFKIDKKPLNMALIAVAGIGRRTKAERKQQRQERKAMPKKERKAAIKKKLKERIKKGLKVAVKFNPATVTARNSFLALVKLNVFGLGKKLAMVQEKKPMELKKFWEKIGGSMMALNNSINIGKKKGHHKKVAGVGFVPAVAAAIASATPIVVKIVSLLKSAGIDTKDLAAAGKAIVEKVANKKIDDMAEDQISQEDNIDFSNSENFENENINDDGPADMTTENSFAESDTADFSDSNEMPDMDDGGGDISGILGFMYKPSIIQNAKHKRFATGQPLTMRDLMRTAHNKANRFNTVNNKRKRFL